MADSVSRRVPLWSLFKVFLRIGLTAFGGLATSVAIIETEFVERRRLLTPGDLSEALAATRFLPGSTLIQVVSYLAYRLRGWPGSVLATVAFVLPSAVLMLLLAALPIFPTSSPVVASLLHGLGLAVVGLLLASTLRLARKSLGSPLAAALALGAFASGGFFKVPAALVVVAAGLIGILKPPADGGEGEGRIKGGRRVIDWELFSRFFVVSVLAFGGGAGIALIERTAVTETGWVSPGEFTTVIALAQLTPGPVMIAATFVGYRAGGLSGATAATIGAFSLPTLLGAAAARQLGRVRLPRPLRGFRRGAAPAAVGLLGVTALSLGRLAVRGWADGLIVIVAVVVALRTEVHPFWVLAGGALLGIVVGECSKAG